MPFLLRVFILQESVKIQPPRMVTAADIDCVRRVAGGLPKGSTTVEFGPWLGAFSTVLADATDLHVVDNFQWTRDHDKKVPGKIAPGDSFLPLFNKIIDDQGLAATIHDCAFADFTWTSGKIDLVVIDAPKAAAMLALCLGSVLPHLTAKGQILLKHGLSPIYTDMVAYVLRLAKRAF